MASEKNQIKPFNNWLNSTASY